jgi:hypothetical protein
MGRWSVGSARAGEALERRAEGGKALVLEEADFRAVLERAERVASEVVEAVRSADHRKEPLDRTHCDRCPVRDVCRPDPARFRARRDEGEDDA